MSFPRPDELASQSIVNRSQDRDANLKKGLKTATKIGASAIGLGAAGNLTSKIIPFLSEHIPVDLAFKGISKISPRLGSFLDKGVKAGLDIRDGINYIKDNLGTVENATPPKENRNIIEQYSPELHQIISDGIKKGKSPIQAATEAVADAKFAKIVQKIAGDHGTSFSAILESVYGPSNDANRSTNPFAPPQVRGQASLQPQQPQANQQPQPGPGEQALMAKLQKLIERRAGR